MPVRKFQRLGFHDIMLLRDDRVEHGSLLWLLRDKRAMLFPSWLFAGWRGEAATGREAWPAPLLMSLLLLRYSEAGMTRSGTARRAAHDAQWRAALQLPWDVRPPHEKTLREFEAFLRANHPQLGVPRVLAVFEHWTRLCLDNNLVNQDAAWVIDSTPMWCYGAVLCTVNLLGEGIRSLAKRWARARGTSLAAVAKAWAAPLVLAKSTKGFFDGTDWSDVDARSEVLVDLSELALRCVECVTTGLDGNIVRANKRLPLQRLCRNVLRVMDDLETGPDGKLQVAHRATRERLISLTDPDAQHFRKSASKVCRGFKLHVLGDAMSGLIVALSVTPGGRHDSTEAHPLILRGKALHAAILEVLGDAAYGGMRVRHAVRETGVTLLAPPLSGGHTSDTLGKSDCEVDFDAMVATCPGGVATSRWKLTKRDGDQRAPTFAWAKDSDARCACADRCPVHRRRHSKVGRTRAPLRRLHLHPDERELRHLRAEWRTPEIRQRYRRRTQGERLVHEMTRRGARRASAWGVAHATVQAYCIAAVNNLVLLARTLGAAEQRKRAA